MLDAVDDHQSVGVIGLVDDAVPAASSRARAGQLSLKHSTESMGVVEECAEHEFDGGGCGAFGEPVELPFGGTGDAQRVAEPGHGIFAG